MFFRKINIGNFTQRKQNTLLNKIISFLFVMRFCRNCVCSRISCRVDKDSKKYVSCVLFDCSYDLVISSAIIKRIQNDKKRIREKVRKVRVAAVAAKTKTNDEFRKAQTATAKINRLERQFEFLENREKKLISTEWQNIAELKIKKQVSAATDLLFDFPFDVVFEQFYLPASFD